MYACVCGFVYVVCWGRALVCGCVYVYACGYRSSYALFYVCGCVLCMILVCLSACWCVCDKVARWLRVCDFMFTCVDICVILYVWMCVMRNIGLYVSAFWYMRTHPLTCTPTHSLAHPLTLSHARTRVCMYVRVWGGGGGEYARV